MAARAVRWRLGEERRDAVPKSLANDSLAVPVAGVVCRLLRAAQPAHFLAYRTESKVLALVPLSVGIRPTYGAQPARHRAPVLGAVSRCVLAALRPRTFSLQVATDFRFADNVFVNPFTGCIGAGSRQRRHHRGTQSILSAGSARFADCAHYIGRQRH